MELEHTLVLSFNLIISLMALSPNTVISRELKYRIGSGGKDTVYSITLILDKLYDIIEMVKHIAAHSKTVQRFCKGPMANQSQL